MTKSPNTYLSGWGRILSIQYRIPLENCSNSRKKHTLCIEFDFEHVDMVGFITTDDARERERQSEKEAASYRVKWYRPNPI